MLPIRFGAIIPIIGEQTRVNRLVKKIEKRAKRQGLKVALEHGPQEPMYFDEQRRELRMLAGMVVHTGKDADHFEAYQIALKKYADETNRYINHQLKELGPMPILDNISTEQYWKLRDAYEKKFLVWGLFNPMPHVPSPYDFGTRVHENYGDFLPIEQVEKAFQNKTLDISG